MPIEFVVLSGNTGSAGDDADSVYDILGLAICASVSGDARLAATLHGGASALIHSTGAEWESGLDRYRDPDITACFGRILVTDFRPVTTPALQ